MTTYFVCWCVRCSRTTQCIHVYLYVCVNLCPNCNPCWIYGGICFVLSVMLGEGVSIDQSQPPPHGSLPQTCIVPVKCW